MDLRSETVEAVANATKALAETAGKAIDAVQGLGRFADKLIGNALAEGGGMVTDQVRYWRRMQLLQLTTKFDSACAARGLSPETMKPISLGKTVQVLEAASLEEEDEVQQLWAELLANAVDPNSTVTLKKMYVTLLKDLGPAEVALLDALRRFRSYKLANSMLPGPGLKDIESKALAVVEERWRKFSDTEQSGAISNLRRMGCIAPNLGRAPAMDRLLTQVRVEGFNQGLMGNANVVTRVDPQKLQNLFRWIVESLFIASGGLQKALPSKTDFVTPAGIRVGSVAVPELSIALTPLGQELVEACAPVPEPPSAAV